MVSETKHILYTAQTRNGLEGLEEVGEDVLLAHLQWLADEGELCVCVMVLYYSPAIFPLPLPPPTTQSPHPTQLKSACLNTHLDRHDITLPPPISVFRV